MELLTGYMKIAFSSVAVYLFIIIAIRLFGKKELAQLSVIDLVFILLISNAVQNAMVGSDSSLAGGLVAASALFLINYLFKYLMYRFPKLSIAVQGAEILLIYKGQLNAPNLLRARITQEELLEAVRSMEYPNSGMLIWLFLKQMAISASFRMNISTALSEKEKAGAG